MAVQRGPISAFEAIRDVRHQMSLGIDRISRDGTISFPSPSALALIADEVCELGILLGRVTLAEETVLFPPLTRWLSRQALGVVRSRTCRHRLEGTIHWFLIEERRILRREVRADHDALGLGVASIAAHFASWARVEEQEVFRVCEGALGPFATAFLGGRVELALASPWLHGR